MGWDVGKKDGNVFWQRRCQNVEKDRKMEKVIV
jgi:hypothetical protein